MPRYRTGTVVKLREPLRRSRWHKHGRVRLRRGARGAVLDARRHWRKGRRYDVAFHRRRRSDKAVKSIPASKVKRRLSKQEWELLVIPALVLIGLAALRLG